MEPHTEPVATQYGHYIEQDYQEEGVGDPPFADRHMLNGRRMRRTRRGKVWIALLQNQGGHEGMDQEGTRVGRGRHPVVTQRNEQQQR